MTAILTALLASLAAAGIDLARAWDLLADLDPGQAASLVVAVISVWAAAGLVAGVGGALAVRLARRAFPPRPPSPLGWDAAAAFWAALATGLASAWVLYRLALRFMNAGFHNEELAALLWLVAVAAAVPAAVLLFGAIRPAVAALPRRIPRLAARPFPRTRREAVLAAAAVLAAPAALVATRFAPDFALVDWTHVAPPAAFLAAWGLLAAAFAAALAVPAASRLARRLPRPRAAAALAAAAIPPLAGLAATGAWLLEDNAVRSVMVARSLTAGRAFDRLRAATDRDGDGYSGLFGGGDCDPSDPGVNGMAPDAPGNGIDEDCDGEDRAHGDLASARPRYFEDLVLPGPRPHVVLLLVDALRPDHLASFGYRRDTMPALERFMSERCVVFEDAYATDGFTLHAMAAMFSGRYATSLAWEARRPAPDNGFLTDVLRRAGYGLHAILPSVPPFDPPFFPYRFDRVQRVGFVPGKSYSAGRITEAALDLLDRTPAGPTFVWLHYIEGHLPYYEDRSTWVFGEAAIDRYDAMLRLEDSHIAPVLDRLRDDAWAGRTLVVVAGDHGEEFGEHGKTSHGLQVYEESRRVPLAFCLPAAPGGAPAGAATTAGRVRGGPASLADVLPTVLNAVGVEWDRTDLEGANLLPIVLGRAAPDPDRVLFTATSPKKGIGILKAAVQWRQWRLVRDVAANTDELYDVAADPGQRTNLAASAPPDARLLHDVLKRWLADRATLRPAPPAAPAAQPGPADAGRAP